MQMNEYEDFLKKVSGNVKKKRLELGKTVEDVTLEGLNQSSTAFYSQAENLRNGKHFNLKHLFLLAKYFECDVEEFIK